MDGRNLQTSKETRRAIVTLHSHGLSIPEVAQQLGISHTTVRNWLRRYKSTASVKDLPRGGRPRLTTAQQDRIITEAVKADPLTTAAEIQRQHQLPCSVQTIRNRLHTLKSGGHTPAKPPVHKPPKSSAKRKIGNDTETESSPNSSSLCGQDTQQKKHMTAALNSGTSSGDNRNTCVKQEPTAEAGPDWAVMRVKQEEEDEIKMEVKEEAVEEERVVLPITVEGNRTLPGSVWTEGSTASHLDHPVDRLSLPSPIPSPDSDPLELGKLVSTDSNQHVLGAISHQGAALPTSHPLETGPISVPILSDTDESNCSTVFLISSDEDKNSCTFLLSDSEESEEWEEMHSEEGDEHLSRATLLDSDSSSIDSENDEAVVGNSYAPLPEKIQEVPWNWKTNNFIPNLFPFDSLHSGVAAGIPIKEDASELDCFLHFFDVSLMGLITLQTNKQYKYLTLPSLWYLDGWRDVTVKELYVFLGLCMLMPHIGHEKGSGLWSTIHNTHPSIHSKIMTEARYRMISKMLHFSSNAVPTKDPLAKIRPVYSCLQNKFRAVVIPFRNLVIDESQILFKNRLTFRHYIPSKNHDYEVKIYILCDCKTGFVVDFLIYSSAATEGASRDYHGTTGAIVKRLLEPLYGKGHTLYVGNWCSSPQLFHYFLTKKVGACGMVKPDQKFCPKFRNIPRGKSVRYHANNILALKWHDRTPVHILSTVHGWETTNRNRPQPVADYRNICRRFGISDIQTNCQEVRVVKWYKKLFYHLLDLTVLNAYTLFVIKTGTRPKYRAFHRRLIKQIFERFGNEATEHRHKEVDKSLPLRFMLSKGHFVRLLSERGDEEMQRSCFVCANTKCQPQKDTATGYYCSVCDVPLCVVPCFERYHTFKEF